MTLQAALVLALGACSGPEPEYFDLPDDTGGDDTPAVVDCPGGEIDSDVATSSGAEGAVPMVSFTTRDALAARVSFEGPGGKIVATDWDEPGTQHELYLLGALPGADVSYTVEVEVPGDACTAAGRLQASPLPGSVPVVNVSTLDEDRGEGSFLATPIIVSAAAGTAWVTILDPAGEVVFAAQPVHTMGFVTPSWRAAPARDGRGLLYLTGATSTTDPGSVVRLALDGTVVSRVDVPGAHTDFVELSGGRLAFLVWDLRQVGEHTVLGDKVVVVEADGTQRDVWNAFDHLDFDPEGDWSAGFYVPDPEALDWTHLNGIAYDEAGDDLLVTMAAYDGVVRIDASTGEQAWHAGNGVGDFVPADEGDEVLALPHSVQALDDDTLLVFNRGDYATNPGVCSWAALVELDHAAGTMRTGQRWTGDDCLLVAFLGQARALPGGSYDLDWSSAGRLDEVGADGTLLRRLELDLGAAFGFTTRM